MRTVDIGGRTVELSGSILAPLTWYNQFGDDGLFQALMRVETKMSLLDVLKLAWVMAHDADVAAGREAMGFDRWCQDVAGECDFSTLREQVVAESDATWFRAAAERIEAEQRKAAEQDAG